MALKQTTCGYCGKIIRREESWVKKSQERGWKMYCSTECRIASKNKRREYKCSNCGKTVIKRPCDVKKSLSGNVFCSHSCAASYNNSHYRTGENNPNWNNFGSSYKRKAKEAYKPKCVICDESDEDVLEVHHLDNNHSNNDLDNLIILCSNHHKKLHRRKCFDTKELKDKRDSSYKITID